MNKNFYGPLTATLLLALGMAAAVSAAPFNPPTGSPPAGELGASIERGRLYLTETGARLPENVGNALSCQSCHLNAGTVQNASPWVGVTALFPQFRPRSGKVITLEQRINACFERSMNGKPLAPDHPAMVDMMAYMSWLSQGVPVGSRVEGLGIPRLELARAGDVARGRDVYGTRCAACHGAEGQGLKGGDGKYVFPPVWGDQSFNIAAGMARLFTAAGFIKHNMPLGAGGTLSDDDAYDAAAFMLAQPRPDFPGKANDWPDGGKPKDAPY